MSILDQAAKITSKDRQEKYGHPADNFNNIADSWNTYLNARPEPQAEVNARDVGMMMILLKVMRDAHMIDIDDLIDIAGYARCIEMLDEV